MEKKIFFSYQKRRVCLLMIIGSFLVGDASSLKASQGGIDEIAEADSKTKTGASTGEKKNPKVLTRVESQKFDDQFSTYDGIEKSNVVGTDGKCGFRAILNMDPEDFKKAMAKEEKKAKRKTSKCNLL